jgi:RNA polymerase sigma-70 factor (ECF subfamily)
VFTIAHNRLTDERRRAARRPVRADQEVPETLAAAFDAEDEAARRLATERVRRLCDGLAPDQRDVLLLRMLADLTIEDIATALGKTPGAVKALQRRGLATLRRQLERDGSGRLQGVPL